MNAAQKPTAEPAASGPKTPASASGTTASGAPVTRLYPCPSTTQAASRRTAEGSTVQ